MRTPLSLLVAGLLAAPAVPAAQSVATFDDLRLTLRSEDRLIVTDKDGHKTRGRFASLTDGVLTVSPTSRFRFRRGQTKTNRLYRESDVTQVKRIDPSHQGYLLGLGVGAGLGLAPCLEDNNPGDGSCAVAALFAVPLFSLIGMAVGTVIDASINETIYRNPKPRPTVLISPAIGHKSAGVSIALCF